MNEFCNKQVVKKGPSEGSSFGASSGGSGASCIDAAKPSDSSGLICGSADLPGDSQDLFDGSSGLPECYRRFYESCRLCPRNCGVNRLKGERGVCGADANLKLGRVALHWWEEPCLVGKQGSGAVFFSYCPMHCVYCQNRGLAAGDGIEVADRQLENLILRLQNEEHAANINFVTPTHYLPHIAWTLSRMKQKGTLHVPVVYNCSGYENVEALRLLDGLVDIYLVDFKYAKHRTAKSLSRCADYPQVALAAIKEMLRQVGAWEESACSKDVCGEVFHGGDVNKEGTREEDAYEGHACEGGSYEGGSDEEFADHLLKRGVIIRHLVLPNHIQDSADALYLLHDAFGEALHGPCPVARLSIMNQFVPFGLSEQEQERFGLQGVVSEEEYDALLDVADSLGFEDYFWQEGGANIESFIPEFDGTGVF